MVSSKPLNTLETCETKVIGGLLERDFWLGVLMPHLPIVKTDSNISLLAKVDSNHVRTELLTRLR